MYNTISGTNVASFSQNIPFLGLNFFSQTFFLHLGAPQPGPTLLVGKGKNVLAGRTPFPGAGIGFPSGSAHQLLEPFSGREQLTGGWGLLHKEEGGVAGFLADGGHSHPVPSASQDRRVLLRRQPLQPPVWAHAAAHRLLGCAGAFRWAGGARHVPQPHAADHDPPHGGRLVLNLDGPTRLNPCRLAGRFGARHFRFQLEP